MKHLLLILLFALPYCSNAIIRASRPTPVLVSIFDKTQTNDAAAPAPHYSLMRPEYDTPPKRNPENSAQFMARAATIVGALFLFIGLLALAGAQMKNNRQAYTAQSSTEAYLAQIGIAAGTFGLATFITGLVMTFTSRDNKPLPDDQAQ